MHRLVTHVLRALEEYHPETAAHSRRVACYGALLLPRCGQNLVQALLCHDVGKLDVPLDILQRQGALSLTDWPALQSHPLRSEERLRALARSVVGGELPRCFAVVARSHHERWDGRGYPDGLRGRGIPFLARCAAICDAFDAMTTRRYRLPLPPQAAAHALINGAGSQFDPRLAHALAPRLAATALIVLPSAHAPRAAALSS